jgi:hypothetical protein
MQGTAFTYLPKPGGARDNKFLVTHLMYDQRCLTSAIARRSALTAVPSSSSLIYGHRLSNYKLLSDVWCMYEFESSNTTRMNFAIDACFVWKLAPLADERNGIFHRISIATIDATEHVFNMANSYWSCWNRLCVRSDTATRQVIISLLRSTCVHHARVHIFTLYTIKYITCYTVS